MATSNAQRILQEVAKDGSEEEMRKFLSDRSHVEVNDPKIFGIPPLHIALAWNRDIGVAKVQPTLTNTCIQN
jgi:hypothetical protein